MKETGFKRHKKEHEKLVLQQSRLAAPVCKEEAHQVEPNPQFKNKFKQREQTSQVQQKFENFKSVGLGHREPLARLFGSESSIVAFAEDRQKRQVLS